MNKNNCRELYGHRHNHCYTSPVYREKKAKINKLLAERYSDNENVILWHIKDFYAEKPAVLKNKYKNVTAYYIACRDTGELLDYVYGKIIKESGIEFFDLPYGTTVHSREKDGKMYVFFENYTDESQNISLNKVYKSFENGKTEENSTQILPFGVKVLKEEK